MTQTDSTSPGDFARWLRPSEAISILTAKGLERDVAIGLLVSRLSAEIVAAVAEHVIWKPVGGEVEKDSYRLVPASHWNPNSEWLPDASLWQTGDIYFDLTSGGGYSVSIQGRISYFGVRLEPASVRSIVQGWGEGELSTAHSTLSSARSGRPLSDRWKPWIAELVAYVHDNGIPEGVGSQGQEELINAIADGLAARGEEALGRSTVQAVVQAVLDRLRAAGN